MPDDLASPSDDVLRFGWQFRPVLGSDYVTAGNHEVFAQLALPESAAEDGFVPEVAVQTLWREYDVEHQAIGPVFYGSCSWTKVQDAISIVAPLKVKNVAVQDVGGGIVKVRAEGEFYEPGVTLMTGGTNITPTTFDGKTIQFFAAAHDLLQNGPMELVGENGRPVPLAIPVRRDHSCDVLSASISATPYPDGTSWATVHVEYPNDAKKYLDEFRPLVLIGADVYGMAEKPFLAKPSCEPAANLCTYQFSGSTAAIRAARTFLLRDLTWGGAGSKGAIAFGPAFTALTALKNDPSPSTSPPSVAPTLSGVVASLPTSPGLVGQWTVENVTVEVSAATKLPNPLSSVKPGSRVNVLGVPDSAGRLAASMISVVLNPAPLLAGPITNLPTTSNFLGDWTVGIVKVHVSSTTGLPDQRTLLSKGLEVNVEGTQDVQRRIGNCLAYFNTVCCLPCLVRP